MGEQLSYLRGCFNKSVRELSEYVDRYTPSTVKDYYDLGAMVLAGFAFNDNGSEIFGDARLPVMIFGGLAGLSGAGEDTNRRYRNIYAGLASLCAFWTRNLDLPLIVELENYGIAALLAFGSFDMDRQRIKGKSLEDIS